VAESSLNEYTDILGYMKELAEKDTNKNLEMDDRRTLQEEIYQLQDRLKSIANETTFRGRKLAGWDLSNAKYSGGGICWGGYERFVENCATRSNWAA
jgi:Flagellin and related hook-associated proteins